MFDRRRFLAGASGLGGLALLPGGVFARENAGGFAPVKAMLESYAPAKLPGVAAAVARGTDDAQFFAAGTIAADSTRPVDPDTLFRIYSMTKPVTGIAAMMLIEDGKLGLDQDIGEILPLFKNPRVLIDPTKDLNARPAARPITVRNLLTHTAGLGYTITTKGPLLDAYLKRGITPASASRQRLPGVPPSITAPSLQIFADRLAGLPLIADPGAKWSYSVSIDLLGRVIEVASGMPFDRFLKTRIFDPLGMTSTFFQVPASELARLTHNYGIVPQGRIVIDPGATSIFADPPPFPFGGAGLVSSPRDYDRFLLMLAGYGAIGGTRVMKTETAKLAMSNLLPPGAVTEGTYAAGQGFGAGGRVTIASDTRGSGIGTFGWGGAAATIAWVDPTKCVRASGYAQYMPDSTMPFTTDFGKAVYASL